MAISSSTIWRRFLEKNGKGTVIKAKCRFSTSQSEVTLVRI